MGASDERVLTASPDGASDCVDAIKTEFFVQSGSMTCAANRLMFVRRRRVAMMES